MRNLIRVLATLALLLPAAALADKYDGKVDESKRKYVAEKERELDKLTANANETCGAELTAAVDWTTFSGDWSNTWHAGSVTGYCTQVMRAVVDACFDGKRSKIRKVKKVRCYYEPKLEPRHKSPDTLDPMIKIDGDTMHAGYNETEKLGSFTRPVKNAMDKKYVKPAPAPSAKDAKYMGMVPARYFRNDMMEDAEKGLANMKSTAEEHCAQKFDLTIDWKSFDDDWDNLWNPIGFVGSCKQFFEHLGGACYDGHKKGLKKIKKVRCHYSDKLKPLKDSASSEQWYFVGLKRKGDTLHVGYQNYTYYTPVAEMLGKGKKKKRKTRKKRRRR